MIDVRYGVTLLMNNTCNKRCKYCYENNVGDSVMSLAQIDYILKRVWNLPGFNHEVLFFGGEPTLSLNVIRDCVKKYPDLHYSIITNGYFLMNFDYSEYEFLKHVSLNVSLEGTSRSFKELRGDENLFKYLEKIKHLVDLGWNNITVNISINGLLMQDLDEFVRICLFLKHNNIGIHLYSLNGEDFFKTSSEYLELLIAIGKKSNWLLRKIVGEPEDADTEFLCALENSMTFDGDLCLVDCGRDKIHPIKIANLSDDQLLLEFATRVSKTHISLFPACQECEVPVGNCTRSCPAFINEMLSCGNYDKLNSSCEKEVIKNRIRTGQIIIDEDQLGLSNNITHLELILTNGCNMNCKYCFEHKTENIKVMSIETLNNSLFLAECSNDTDHIDVTLFGGEPLLRSTLPTRLALVDYIRTSNKKFNVAIVTNLFSVTQQDLEWLKELKTLCSHLNVQVSIDSIHSINDMSRVDLNGDGTFLKVIDNLHLLSEYIGQECITINSVLSTLNHVKYLVDWMKYLDDISSSFNNIQYNFDQCKHDYDILEWQNELNDVVKDIYQHYNCGDLSLKVVKPFLNYSKRFINSNSSGCDALTHSITVDSDGWVIPCHFNIGDKSKYIYSVNDAVYSDNYKEMMLSYLSQDSYLCKTCDVSSDCRRCKVAGLQINGGIPCYTCEIHKSFYDIKESVVGDQFRFFSKEEMNDFKRDLNELHTMLENNTTNEEINSVVLNMVRIYNQRRR